METAPVGAATVSRNKEHPAETERPACPGEERALASGRHGEARVALLR